MKLQTTIKPRNDGTVIAYTLDKKIKLVFKANEEGVLVCDVECESTAKHLLKTKNFIPYNEEDFEVAANLIYDDSDSDADADTDADADADADSDADNEGDGDNGAAESQSLPIEANTPPKMLKPRRKAK